MVLRGITDPPLPHFGGSRTGQGPSGGAEQPLLLAPGPPGDPRGLRGTTGSRRGGLEDAFLQLTGAEA